MTGHEASGGLGWGNASHGKIVPDFEGRSIMSDGNAKAAWSWAWAGPGITAMGVALGILAVAATLSMAQEPPAKGNANPKNVRGKGQFARKKAPPNAADPLVPKNKEEEVSKEAPIGSYHYRLKLQTYDNMSLAAAYFPAKIETGTPVVLLVHEKDRSSKDFEDPIAELKNQGLAENLQGVGYAVLSFDLRGYGANARRAMSDREWKEMVYDLQAAYHFLLDRHNRGELNLAKLGVVGLGEGANLVASWAFSPGGAVSSEGRSSDIAALALVSPLAEGSGQNFSRLMSALAPRIPVFLMAGERDAISHETVKRIRVGVEKTRQNKVAIYPSSLHGYKLMTLEPKAAPDLVKFLEGTVRLKATEWEPRYNLTPISYNDIQVVRHLKPDDKEKAKAKDAEKEKDAAK